MDCMKLLNSNFFYENNYPIYYVSESIVVVKSINKKAKFCSNLDLHTHLLENENFLAGIFLELDSEKDKGSKANNIFLLNDNMKKIILKYKVKITDLVNFLSYTFLINNNKELSYSFNDFEALNQHFSIFIKSFEDYKLEVISKDTTFNKQRRISKVKIERICDKLKQKFESD
ncbi:hypothetical protein HOK00_07730 [bacterium]|jgi:hypothetical protein|nr:hypothetical protein [bacterium]